MALIDIIVNGERRQAPEGSNLLEILNRLELDPARVAIELDGLIVKRPEWERRTVAPGARLEIVQFVGGG